MYAGDEIEGSSAGTPVQGQARKRRSAKGARRLTSGSDRIMGKSGRWVESCATVLA
jgi:hypothetical protein